MTEQLTHTKKGGIVSHFAVINIKFSKKGSNVPSQVGAETNIQPLSLLPKFLPQCKSTLPSEMGQNILEPEPPVLGVITKVP